MNTISDDDTLREIIETAEAAYAQGNMTAAGYALKARKWYDDKDIDLATRFLLCAKDALARGATS